MMRSVTKCSSLCVDANQGFIFKEAQLKKRKKILLLTFTQCTNEHENKETVTFFYIPKTLPAYKKIELCRGSMYTV